MPDSAQKGDWNWKAVTAARATGNELKLKLNLQIEFEKKFKMLIELELKCKWQIEIELELECSCHFLQGQFQNSRFEGIKVEAEADKSTSKHCRHAWNFNTCIARGLLIFPSISELVAV